jgi:hypothetical protein
MGEERNPHRLLVEKPGGIKPPERPGHKWEGNINMGLRKIR